MDGDDDSSPAGAAAVVSTEKNRGRGGGVANRVSEETDCARLFHPATDRNLTAVSSAPSHLRHVDQTDGPLTSETRLNGLIDQISAICHTPAPKRGVF